MGVVETTHSVCREKWSRHSFIHLVNVLSTYHVPGTVPGAGNITVNYYMKSLAHVGYIL